MKLGVTALLFALSACHDPPIPLNANTTRVCPDGTVCPEWLDCPSYASPGKCGGVSDPTTQWSKEKPDAGPDEEPTDPLLGEPRPGHGGQG